MSSSNIRTKIEVSPDMVFRLPVGTMHECIAGGCPEDAVWKVKLSTVEHWNFCEHHFREWVTMVPFDNGPFRTP